MDEVWCSLKEDAMNITEALIKKRIMTLQLTSVCSEKKAQMSCKSTISRLGMSILKLLDIFNYLQELGLQYSLF